MKKSLTLLLLVSTVLLISGCGGGGGGSADNTGSTGSTGGTVAADTTTTITPFKGKFIAGTVSLIDANRRAVPLLNGSGAINANGVASVTYASNVVYPLIISVTGTYLDEITGASTVSTVPLRGFIPNADAAAVGVPVTAITEIAVAKVLQQTPASMAITPYAAVTAITETADAVAGQFYSQAMSPPVFDAEGKTTSPATLQLAALSVVANTHGVGVDLTAKINSMAQDLAIGNVVAAVIPQADFDNAVNAVNGGTYNMLPAGSSALVIPPHTMGTTALGVVSTPYNGYAAIAEGGFNRTTSMALKYDGSLWTWAGNVGQWYDGTFKYSIEPTQVGTGYTAIAIGDSHTVALKADGSLWVWGDIFGYQFSLVPKQIGTGYTAIASGPGHSLALKADGSLWAWGMNDQGQFGDGMIDILGVPVLSPKQVGTGFTAIAAGADLSLALKADGSLWTWGAATNGQLGNGAVTASFNIGNYSCICNPVPKQIGTGFTAIAARQNHSLALKADGSLWAWGYNKFGQVGDGTGTEFVLSPKQVGTGFTAISAGGLHSTALKADGSLWAWGNNLYGQLGDGTTINRPIPKKIGTGYIAVAAGYSSTIALVPGGNLWAWGDVSMTNPTMMGWVPSNNVPVEAATGRTTNRLDIDALNDYPSNPGQIQCIDGTIWDVVHLTGPCGGAANNFNYAELCVIGDGGRAQTNYWRCAMDNSTGAFKEQYANQYNYASGAQVTLSPGDFCYWQGTQPGHINWLGYCSPGAPETTRTTGTGGTTTLTDTQIAAAEACAVAPYDNPPSVPYDPQFDSNCWLAQFDACLHSATGQTTYDAEGRGACSVVSGIINATGSTARCNYCPFPY